MYDDIIIVGAGFETTRKLGTLCLRTGVNEPILNQLVITYLGQCGLHDHNAYTLVKAVDEGDIVE